MASLSRRMALLITVGSFLAVSGCGRSDLAKITGRVTLDGEPIENAVLRFIPHEKGSVSVGRTDANGEYYAMFSTEVERFSPGETVVKISTYDVDVDEPRGRGWSVPARSERPHVELFGLGDDLKSALSHQPVT